MNSLCWFDIKQLKLIYNPGVVMGPQELLRNPKVFWALWGLVAISWQINSLKTHNGATGSETTRAVWRVHTKPGKYAFMVAFYGGSLIFVSWFPRHILRPAIESIASVYLE